MAKKKETKEKIVLVSEKLASQIGVDNKEVVSITSVQYENQFKDALNGILENGFFNEDQIRSYNYDLRDDRFKIKEHMDNCDLKGLKMSPHNDIVEIGIRSLPENNIIGLKLTTKRGIKQNVYRYIVEYGVVADNEDTNLEMDMVV